MSELANAQMNSKDMDITEKDLVFDKSYRCPVCNKDFKSKTVKVGKARQNGADIDLRPIYQNIDSLKYDTIMCPNCGYTAFGTNFNKLIPREIKSIKERIGNNFHRKVKEVDVVSYDIALENYKLALLTAMVKEAKDSEKAYICLKTAWIIRGKRESLENEDNEFALVEELENKENEFLRSAMSGFLSAREKETPPFFGMDEYTIDYLLAYLCIRFENFDYAKKLISNIMLSSNVNRRIKDKTSDLKELLKQKLDKK